MCFWAAVPTAALGTLAGALGWEPRLGPLAIGFGLALAAVDLLIRGRRAPRALRTERPSAVAKLFHPAAGGAVLAAVPVWVVGLLVSALALSLAISG